jgi:hypothetical protein
MNWGPWYIAKLQNKDGKEKIVVHTYAPQFANVLKITEPQEGWRLLEYMGPIDILEHAERIGNLQNLNLKDASQHFHYEYRKVADPEC